MSGVETVDVVPNLDRVGENVIFGCDPEFFFADESGGVVGAEKVLPKNGELVTANRYGSLEPTTSPKFVLDGVQVELHPKPTSCRAQLSNDICAAFKGLKAHLDKSKFKASFKSVIDIDKGELDGLSDKAKVFGCAPSLSNYGKGNEVSIDASTYTKRAAGGHIHMGFDIHRKLYEHREELVPILDILVGIPCVLIDRDPEAATRRLHYGRAGEYRLPKHGLEYRTLSNFWLRHYRLMSFVMGMCRMSFKVLAIKYRDLTYPKWTASSGYTPEQWEAYYPKANYISADLSKELIDSVNMKDVERAINENDLKLAQEIYYASVRPFIKKYVKTSQSMGLAAEVLNEFDFFLKKLWDKGIEYWFPDDPLEHWSSKPDGHGQGWESFMREDVRNRMNAESRVLPFLDTTLLNMPPNQGQPTNISGGFYAPPTISSGSFTIDYQVPKIKREYYRDEFGRFTSLNRF